MNTTTVTRQQVISNVSDLMNLVDHFEYLNRIQGPMLFRGQPETYLNLEPSFTRAAKDGQNPVSYRAVALLEKQLVENFQKHHDEVFNERKQPMSKVELLSLMQHYEVPTRLLDWSECVWTSVFFACASNPGSNGELWFFEESILDLTPEQMPRSAINELVEKSIGGLPPEYHPKWGMPFFTLIEPAKNDRIRAQKGKLTASVNACVNHADALWRLANLKHGPEIVGESFGRVIITAKSKPKILSFLEKQGIDAKTLFPDVVGLQRYLRWQFESLKTQLF